MFGRFTPTHLVRLHAPLLRQIVLFLYLQYQGAYTVNFDLRTAAQVIKTGIFFFLPRCSHTGNLLPLLEHRAEFPQFLDQGQSVGLLGRVISSSQGLYLYTNIEKHTQIHKH
jgi:hypothetical protein